ncbi:MAG: hypothetical protein R2762_14810 [Bryobacteraceae bacterium]
MTPPIGAPLFTGPATAVADRLDIRGLVIYSAQAPVVIASIDWCEIRNDSYDLWRARLASAAGTTRERVLLSAVHPHDAPYTDSGAHRYLDDAGLKGSLCDPAWEATTIGRVADAIRQSNPEAVTHIGVGRARVSRVASNRRYVKPDGTVSFGRTSATRDAAIRAMPEGLIDPWLRTLTFWDGRRRVAALSVYSTHPMSYYGRGEVTPDFPGLARNRLQAEDPGTFHVYASGASGDTMAGKYNDGAVSNRAVLAGRMYGAMRASLAATRKTRLSTVGFRNVEMRMKARGSDGFRTEQMRAVVENRNAPWRDRHNAALGLSWLDRLGEGRPIDVPAVDLGAAKLVLLPAEAFVQYQLWAQQHGPFVITLGYGECAPGYIPTARDVAEGYNDHYCWVDMETSEATMRGAIGKALE